MTGSWRTTALRLPWFEVETNEAFADAVTAMAWSPSGGAVAAGSLDGAVRTITPGGRQGSSTARHPGGALCLAWSHDGAWLASGGADGHLVVRHQHSGSGVEVEMDGWVRVVGWSRHGWLAAAAGPAVQLAHLDDGQWHALAPHPGTVTALAWSDEAVLAAPPRLAVGGVGGMRWYEPSSGEEPVGTRWGGAALLSLAVDSARGAVAAGCLQGGVRVAGLGSGPCTKLHGSRGPVRRLAWSTGGSRLAAVDERRIAVWDRSRGGMGHPKALMSLSGHAGAVADVAWAPAGGLLASVGLDGQLALWKPDETPDPLQRIDLGEPLSCLAWRPDGAGLAVGGEAGSLHLLGRREPSFALRAR